MKNILLFDREAVFQDLVKETDAEITRTFAIPLWMIYPIKPIRMETVILDPASTLETETPVEKPKPEEKESEKDLEKRARKPPKEGPCRDAGWTSH